MVNYLSYSLGISISLIIMVLVEKLISFLKLNLLPPFRHLLHYDIFSFYKLEIKAKSIFFD